MPQIVDERTFSRVQRRLESNKHIGAINKAKTVYLLAGKVYSSIIVKSMKTVDITGVTGFTTANILLFYYFCRHRTGPKF